MIELYAEIQLLMNQNTQKAVQEKENISLRSDERHDDVEQDDVSETAAVKLPSSSQIQEFFREKLPKKVCQNLFGQGRTLTGLSFTQHCTSSN